jgi:hypothetical protein
VNGPDPHRHARPADPHVADEALVNLYFDHLTPDLVREVSARRRAHLARCQDCASRYAAFASWFDRTADDARREADAAFSDDRLKAQRAAILDTLERVAGPARILAFPAAAPLSVARRPALRWTSLAAAAGLILGVTLGYFVHLPLVDRAPRTASIDGAQPALVTRATPGPRPARAAFNEEDFLVEIDAALTGPAIRELQAIDALTPAIREVRNTLR